MTMKKSDKTPWNILINLLWVYICYEICRLAFLFENWGQFKDTLTWTSFFEMLRGGLFFDTSAICYTNSLYLLLILFPLHFKETLLLRKITKWIFVVTNSACIVMNLMDTVYFSFTGRRVTADVIYEFGNENNLGSIIGIEIWQHWYFVLLAALLIWFLIKCYRDVQTDCSPRYLKHYYLRQTLSLVIIVPLTVCGMRGSLFTTATRPIAISNAHQFVKQPSEANIVLNTPFSIIRTLTNKPVQIPAYFSRAELDSLYSPVHRPDTTRKARKKNVVILIVESFAQEFIGARNRHLDGGKYKGYTPFIDSLLSHSLTWRETINNTLTSIDAMPAVLASIPKFRQPFVLTRHSMNDLNSLPGELRKWGYHTAFFHGAENSSMGFHAFARAIGFSEFYGRNEFEADPRFGGEKEFDGTWGIWDEPFLQYYCAKMNEMEQPFMTAVFTLSSHHPFAIPDKYKDVFKDEGIHRLHKCIRYADHAIRKFFEAASLQPWYPNTVFVITADHASSKTTHAEYKTELGCRVPVIFFDPSGELPTGCRDGIAQQIDIMPTLLSWLGYDKPYIAFGQDMLHTKPADTWALNYAGIPLFAKGDYLLEMKGDSVSAIYNYRKDSLLQHNLKGKVTEQADMEKLLKAILQSYSERMNRNDVSIKP